MCWNACSLCSADRRLSGVVTRPEAGVVQAGSCYAVPPASCSLSRLACWEQWRWQWRGTRVQAA